MTTFNTDLILGEKYRDAATGVEGVLTSVHFYQHACERASLRFLDKNGQVCVESFDAPELVAVKSGKAATTTKKGGPKRAEGGRRD